MISEPATSHSSPATDSDEVLVRVEGVSKKFCRSLKRSLWYGICDIAGELNPFAKHGAGPPARRAYPPAWKPYGLEAGSERSGEHGARGTAEVAGGELGVTSHNKGAEGGNILPATSHPPLATSSPLRPGEFWAVNDVSFELRRGECLGLIGHNGAGKTTLLKMLNGLIKPDTGRIEMNGRVGALIALGAGFNPILTGRENIYINGSVLGLSKKEIDEKIDEIIDFAEIGKFIDMPVQNYSSGMQVRLGFAVATALDPDILILDEVLAVGDASFRSKCFQRIGALIKHCAVVFVSHDPYSVRRICDQVIWLKAGVACYQGQTDEGMKRYSADIETSLSMPQLQLVAEYITSISTTATAIEDYSWESGNFVRLNVEIAFHSARESSLGLSMLNIVAPGEQVVAQAMLQDCLPAIQKGFNQWRFSVPYLRLSSGSYTVTLGIFEPDNRRFALNIRNFYKFVASGNFGFYPLYAPYAVRPDQ